MAGYYSLSVEYIGVNISGQKGGTERTKKRKKLELVSFPTARGATGTVVHRLDATRILPELRSQPGMGSIFIPGPTRPELSRKTHTILQTDTWHDQMVILYYEMHSFRIIGAHGCNDMLPTLQMQSELALPSTESESESECSFI